MLTDRQKTLLMIQTNLDQIEAGIRHGLEDPKCVDEDKAVVEEMRTLAEAMQATVRYALRALHT